MVYIDEHIMDFDLDAALQQISEQRREQALRFKFERGQRTCVLAYLLLRKALRQEYGIHENPIFEYNAHGKPSIIGHPDIHFNLSHCREAVACAVSPHPIGIDVESVSRYNDSVARYTMNESEQHQILQSDTPAEAFIRLWTMKEATLKRSGEGIRNNMKDVLSGQHALETFVNKTRGYVYTVAY